MKNSIKLENIGCLITESASGFDYKNNTSLVLEGDCIKSIGSGNADTTICLLYTSPSPRDGLLSRMPSSA